LEWLRDVFRSDPHWATFWCGVGLAFLMGIAKFLRDRHKETMMLRAHVRREEAAVWPGIAALDEKVTGFHAEMLRQFGEQGQRIARVESRMPNGELREIKDLLRQAIGRNRVR